MQKFLFALSLGIGGLILALQPAQSQSTSCAERQLIVERLATRYGESRQSLGIGQNNSVVELFASADTGTWSLLVTVPGGQTCLVAAGEAFEAVSEPLTIPGEGA
jgi:hypothetical protein